MTYKPSDPVPPSLHDVFKNASVFFGFALLISTLAAAIIAVHLVYVAWPSMEKVSITEMRERIDRLETAAGLVCKAK